MTARLAVASALSLGIGVTLVSTEFRWGRRRPLASRVAPYDAAREPAAISRPPGPLVALALPVVTAIEMVVNRTVGAPFELQNRLARAGSALDPVGFRLQQLAAGVAGLAIGLVMVTLVRPAWPAALLAVTAAAGLGLLWPEQRLRAASDRACRAVEQELPLVLEQLATMLDAGSSIRGALQRIADRGSGLCSHGFGGVCARIRHGVSEHEALEDWARLAGVAGARRLCTLLALPAPDLGRLLEVEARQLRRDAHRRLVERIERRTQQVWIPVTVATLVPGVLFLSVPFIEAMRLFSAT